MPAAAAVAVLSRPVNPGAWRSEQTSNAYELIPAAVRPIAAPAVARCGGQVGRETRKVEILSAPPIAPAVAAVARDVLERVRKAMESKLMNKARM